jgi:hypothetical protein
MLTLRFSGCDPNVWSGRALQGDFVDLADAVLHQCIRPLVGALLPAIMDISARAISLPDRSRWTIWVTSVRMRREDRSSISSHPLADLGGQSVDYIIDNSSSRAVPLFVPRGRSFVPACACRRTAREGRQGWPSCWRCLSLRRFRATP